MAAERAISATPKVIFAITDAHDKLESSSNRAAAFSALLRRLP
jgi:hypothetical protein